MNKLSNTPGRSSIPSLREAQRRSNPVALSERSRATGLLRRCAPRKDGLDGLCSTSAIKNTSTIWGVTKLITWCFFVLLSLKAQAAIQVQVDPSQVSMGQVFRLFLIQKESPNGGLPDLVSLQKDFVILGTERNVSYSLINGQAQSMSQWIVALRAKKSGILTIPAIKIGLEQSTPLTINVEAKGSKTQEASTDASSSPEVILTASVDQKKPYVNQQIIYTVKLYNNKRLLDAHYQGPQVEDALLIPLGGEKRYQAMYHQVNYDVEEQRYAIFPQKSGSLKITSPVFTALVYDLDPNRVEAKDKDLSLKVQPIPAQYKGSHWLPAKQIRLTERYDQLKPTMTQGSTLTRTVVLEGVGVPAQLLPLLHFEEGQAFSIYPEKGVEHNKLKEGQLVGKAETKVTYLFNKAGKVFLPELRLSWFNTVTGKEEVALLGPKSIEILPSANASSQADSQGGNQKKAEILAPPEIKPTAPLRQDWPWLFALFFALAWVLTLGMWKWQRPARPSGKRLNKKVLKALQQACLEGNAKAARDALLKWARLHWPDASIFNLNDLILLVKDAQVKKQIQGLSKVLYGQDEKQFWQGEDLFKAVLKVKPALVEIKKRTGDLPPMHPF